MGGGLPYHNKSNDQMVIIALWREEPPLRPDGAPDELWELARACLTFTPAARPTPMMCLRYMRMLPILAGDQVRAYTLQCDRE